MKKLNVDIEGAIKKLHIITKQLISTQVAGNYISIFRGRGLEFESYRNYTPVDDASLIDWKASARAKELMVKEFREEKKLEVFFLIDVSNSMIFGSTPKLKNEFAVETVAALAYAIIAAGDKVGFALFNDKIIKKYPPEAGPKQFHRLTKTLLDVNNHGGGFNLDNALEFSLNYIKKKGALVFIVSDFLGMKSDLWKQHLQWVSAKHDVVCIVIRDPRDKYIPKQSGQIVIQDPYSDREMIIDSELISEQYTKHAIQNEKEIIQVGKESKADVLIIYTDESFVKPLISLFRMRAMKWR